MARWWHTAALAAMAQSGLESAKGDPLSPIRRRCRRSQAGPCRGSSEARQDLAWLIVTTSTRTRYTLIFGCADDRVLECMPGCNESYVWPFKNL